MEDDYIIFCGTGGRKLGSRTARLLERCPGHCLIGRFPDGEINIELEESVRGREVYIIQSTSPPVDQHLVELLALVDACRRAAARRITTVIPYFGYGRADKRGGKRAPLTGSLVAHMLEGAGVNHVVTVDLHMPQVEGFFNIPVDSVTAVPAFCHALRQRLPDGIVVVSPDEGRVRMASEYGRRLHAPIAILHKERRGGSSTRVTHFVGEVRGRPCLIVDDIISTGNTVREAIETLVAAGAQESIWVAATHGLFVGNAIEQLKHRAIQEIFVSDTVPLEEPFIPRLSTVTLSPLLAGVIRRFRAGESLADVYDHVIHGGFEEVLSN